MASCFCFGKKMMLRKSHWKQNKERHKNRKKKKKKELTLHWEIAVFLDEESKISFLVDSELEVNRAGIWNARCWDMPLGDKAIVTRFFVICSTRTSPCSKIGDAGRPGWGVGSRCSEWRGAGWPGWVRMPNRDFSWSTEPTCSWCPSFGWYLFSTQRECMKPSASTVGPETHTHIISSRTNHRVKRGKVMQNATFTS